MAGKCPGFSNDKGRWRFQRRVPEDVRHAFGGRAFIRFPLECTTEAEAKRSALAWYVTYDMAFAEARDKLRRLGSPGVVPGVQSRDTSALSKPLSAYTPEEMRALVEPAALGLDHRQHEAIATGATVFAALATDNQWLDGATRDVLSGKGSEPLTILSMLLLTSKGITPDTQEAIARFTYVNASVLQSRTVKPGALRLKGEHVEPVTLPPTSSPFRIEPPSGLTLGRVVREYLSSLPENHYYRKIDLCLTLFVETVGAGKVVTDLRQTDVRDFLQLVCKLPSNWGKLYRTGKKTVKELLADTGQPRISEATYAANYRATLERFFKSSLRDHGDQHFPSLVADYPYTGTVKVGRDKQRHLEERELRRLFEGPEFAALAADPQRVHHYWLPILGLYTGARPRELCQLNPQCDWGQEEGVWYLTFNETTAAGKGIKKSIKTGETRYVPLHPELVRLGFPEYLQQLKDSGADRLFPGFPVKGGNPYDGAAMRSFSNLLKDTGLYDNETAGAKVTGMYVFRKTFSTYGDEQRINVRPFVGHGEGGKDITEAHYITRAKSIPWLYEAFKGLHYPVTIPKRWHP